jgi:hypothetical protein
VHVDDLQADAVLLEEQGRDETHRTGADDEDLRIGVTKHRAFLSARTSIIVARAMQRTRSPQTRRR